MNLLSSILGGGMVVTPVPERARAERLVLLGVHVYHTASGYRSAVHLHRSGDRRPSARRSILSCVNSMNSVRTARRRTNCLGWREQAKTTLLMGLENTGNRMMTIGRSELLRGEVSKIEEVLDSYDRVTADDILNLAPPCVRPLEGFSGRCRTAGQRGYIPRTASLNQPCTCLQR